MSDEREYRFVSKDESVATSWKPLPKTGLTHKMLKHGRTEVGAGFALELRDPADALSAGQGGSREG